MNTDRLRDENERLRGLLESAHAALSACTHPEAETRPSSECPVCSLQRDIRAALSAAPLTVAPPRENPHELLWCDECACHHTPASERLVHAQGEATPPRRMSTSRCDCPVRDGMYGKHSDWCATQRPLAQEAHAGAGNVERGEP